MNCYEHTLIVRQDKLEAGSKEVINKYEDIIKKNSGKIIKIEEWGLRNLSHIVNNNKKGIYFHIKFNGTGKIIDELNKAENIDQALIRCLTVKVKKHDLKEEYFEKRNF